MGRGWRTLSPLWQIIISGVRWGRDLHVVPDGWSPGGGCSFPNNQHIGTKWHCKGSAQQGRAIKRGSMSDVTVCHLQTDCDEGHCHSGWIDQDIALPFRAHMHFKSYSVKHTPLVFMNTPAVVLNTAVFGVYANMLWFCDVRFQDEDSRQTFSSAV